MKKKKKIPNGLIKQIGIGSVNLKLDKNISSQNLANSMFQKEDKIKKISGKWKAKLSLEDLH